NRHKPNFRHMARFKLSRNITTSEPPVLQSASETLTSIPPRDMPLTADEGESEEMA
ncbi:7811_t:CDS:2, partial [Dentiscutata erythropus]